MDQSSGNQVGSGTPRRTSRSRLLWRAALGSSVAIALAIPSAPAVAVVESTAPYLVKDINPTGASNPRDFIDVDGTLYFTANDGIHGRELWKSDGTQLGTTLVKDIRPGAGGSWASDLTKVGDRLFFVANDGVHGRELWKSDGTSSGTKLVKDLNPGPPDSPRLWYLTGAGDTLFFTHYTRRYGRELWKSDGTSAGTRIVKDIYPGHRGSKPYGLIALGDRIFFGARSSSSPDATFQLYELFMSDGSASGTRLVPSPHVSWPGSGAVVGPRLFVLLSCDPYYCSDPGVWTGTGLAGESTRESIPPYHAFDLVAVGSRGFFLDTENHLWRTDGTAAHTRKVSDLPPCGDNLDDDSCAYNLTAASNRLFFVLPRYEWFPEDGYYERVRDELWVSDRTAAGTGSILDNFPHGGELRELGGAIYFANGGAIWKSDGTDTGTSLAASVAGYPSALTRVGGGLFFSTNDGTHGQELWRYVP